MRFSWAKGNKTCKQCGEVIERGEHQIHITFKGSQGYWIHYYYHQSCYLQYLDLFIRKWFIEHPNPQKKRGRKPVTTYNRERRRQLLALYRYHRKKGNIRRMAQVEDEIRELSYGESPYHDIITVYS